MPPCRRRYPARAAALLAAAPAVAIAGASAAAELPSVGVRDPHPIEHRETALFTFHEDTRRPLHACGALRCAPLRRARRGRYRDTASCGRPPTRRVECDAPRTPLQLYYGDAVRGSRFDEVDLDVLGRPRFHDISTAIAELGVAALVLADKQGGEALIAGCVAACTAPNATGDVCWRSTHSEPARADHRERRRDQEA